MKESEMKNGSKIRPGKIKGKPPIEWKVRVVFEATKVDDGTQLITGGTVPIRKGAFDRLAKYSPKEVATVLRKIADAVETGDFTAFDPRIAAALAGGIEGVKKTVAKAN